ncbi:MAG: hypothetical protein MK212_14530 [Saprospiraceae bacterium]|nr:hypothetical protein [Saprospiraceae bacterium]
MQTSSLLIEILETLNSKQGNQLIELSKSPYWDLKDTDRVFLEKLLKNFKNRYAIYKEQGLDEGVNFKYQKSRLVTFIEHFLLVEAQKAEPIDGMFYLLKYYREHNSQKSFNTKIKNLKKEIKKSPLSNELSLHEFKLNEILLNKAILYRKQTPELKAMYDKLEHFFLENLLRLRAELSNQKQIINADYDVQDLGMPLDKVQTRLGMIYRYIFLLNDPEHTELEEKQIAFGQLKKILINSSSSLAKYLSKTICAYLMNYCARKINRGDKLFAGQYIELVEFLIREDLLLENNMLAPSRYKNIITISLLPGQEDFQFAEAFIRKYSSYLPIKLVKSIRDLNLAHMLFCMGRYNDTFKKIRNMDYRDFDMHHKILYQKLHLKLLYKSGFDDTFEAYLKNFKSFIQNKKELKGTQKLQTLQSFVTGLKCLIAGNLSKILEQDCLAVPDRLWFEQELQERAESGGS